MPKFTIEDVDKQIDEIRERHRQPKQLKGRDLLSRLLETRRGRIPKPLGETTV